MCGPWSCVIQPVGHCPNPICQPWPHILHGVCGLDPAPAPCNQAQGVGLGCMLCGSRVSPDQAMPPASAQGWSSGAPHAVCALGSPVPSTVLGLHTVSSTCLVPALGPVQAGSSIKGTAEGGQFWSSPQTRPATPWAWINLTPLF